MMKLLLTIFLIAFAFIGHELIHVLQLRIKGYKGKIEIRYPSPKMLKEKGFIMAVNWKGKESLLNYRDEYVALGFTLLLLILAGQIIFGY